MMVPDFYAGLFISIFSDQTLNNSELHCMWGQTYSISF